MAGKVGKVANECILREVVETRSKLCTSEVSSELYRWLRDIEGQIKSKNCIEIGKKIQHMDDFKENRIY